MTVNENDYTCGTCKYCGYCDKQDELDIYDLNVCDDWTDPDEPDLTYDGGVMSNFDNENPKEVEDYISEGRERE